MPMLSQDRQLRWGVRAGVSLMSTVVSMEDRRFLIKLLAVEAVILIAVYIMLTSIRVLT